jgi:hypothetical protein
MSSAVQAESQGTLRIDWSLPLGTKGTDDDRQNPLSRALDTLLRTGKPIQKLALCYFIDDVTNPGAEVWRWVGAFVLSVAGSVVFFPGYRRNFDKFISIRTDINASYTNDFHPDHITLVKTFKSSHLTSAESRRHWGNLPTTALGEGRHFWFGMSVEPAELREVKDQTVAVADCPQKDSKRRVDSFMHARDGQVYQGLSLPQTPTRAGFLHLSAIVGPHNFSDYTGAQLGFPYKSPFLAEPPPTLGQLAIRSHRLCFGERVDLQLICTWLPGRLKEDVGITFTG